uniref:Uncharacterized protein n=1 Tax=Octopus bimaculoides TaxID=37653 RepID=A0A0L8HJP5_OCTBM
MPAWKADVDDANNIHSLKTNHVSVAHGCGVTKCEYRCTTIMRSHQLSFFQLQRNIKQPSFPLLLSMGMLLSLSGVKL